MSTQKTAACTLSLYAALETKSGQIIGSTASRHTSQEFVRFLQEVVATQPSGKEIHLIVDNLSAHKTKLVDLRFPRFCGLGCDKGEDSHEQE